LSEIGFLIHNTLMTCIILFLVLTRLNDIEEKIEEVLE